MLTYILIGVAVGFVLLLCFCLAIANFSFDNYNEKLQQLDGVKNSYNITTRDYVAAINHKYFKDTLRLASCPKYYDNYSKKTISLSAETMFSNGLASLSIVSHELGHARQDATGDKLQKHWQLRKVGRIIGRLFLPLILIGIILSVLNVFEVLNHLAVLIVGGVCLGLGVLIFFFAIILKYKEIKIEREASDFAIEYLSEILTENEIKTCKEFLKSARLTYWASLIKVLFGWTFLTKKEKMFY
ncbi:MAG: hypothetical protein E7375_00265 [Clostridiales bacterium]|nr:hypothetical protein [Clostridiales bacterium]